MAINHLLMCRRIQANPSDQVFLISPFPGGMDCLVGCRFDGREFPGYGSLHRISPGCVFFFSGRELGFNKLGLEIRWLNQMLPDAPCMEYLPT